MSSVTDSYQPIESKLGLTRSILETILEAGVQPRLTVQTRSPIVTRGIDLLRRFERLRVSFTVGTGSEAMRLRYEPHCASIARRFATLEELTAAGIRVGVAISPMLPRRRCRGVRGPPGGARRRRVRDAALPHGLGLDPLRRRHLAAYETTRDRLAALLGGPLREGDEGFAPVT